MAKAKPAAEASQEPVPANKFRAAAYAQSHDEAGVTVAVILGRLPSEAGAEIDAVEARLSSLQETVAMHKHNGAYSPERSALHEKIINAILSDEAISAATPTDGERPTFIILGGRGGSGKSWFAGQVYDSAKCVVLDADAIKHCLPEYEGWNAAQVHEESGEIFEQLVDTARALGVNLVLDKTMKTAKSAIADVKAFKDAGYRTEAHYMHLPRQLAAQRAVQRFLGKSKRYVPIAVILANTTNEAAFDEVLRTVDSWSFRDNNVPPKTAPILISEATAKA